MLDELWKQLLAGFALAFGTFVAWSLGRYRDRSALEGEIRFWQAHAGEWRDLASEYRAVVNQRVIEDSDVDEYLTRLNDKLEEDYDRLTQEYKQGPGTHKKGTS